jgi:hypothetical protein
MSIRRNTAYNLLGSVIPLAVSLVTIPIYLNLIGESRYGVLAIAWLLLGYFGLFDLGLGRATAQRIAALRDASGAERAETFWTALAMNLCLGVFGALLMWPVAGYFFGQVFKIDDALRPEMLAAIPWLMLAVSRKRALTPFALCWVMSMASLRAARVRSVRQVPRGTHAAPPRSRPSGAPPGAQALSGAPAHRPEAIRRWTVAAPRAARRRPAIPPPVG